MQSSGINKSIAEQTVVVILAAGKGTRMGREDMAKVCFEIDGVPAINRIIETFRKKRFEKFLLVVGSMAGQVMEVVGKEHPNVMFVCQSPQLGTGHAGKVAAETLQVMGHTGDVLLAMGDKYIEPEAVDMLLEGFIKQQADMALLTIPRSDSAAPSSGRVFTDKNGQAVGIIEQVDLARQAIADGLRKYIVKSDTIAGLTIKKIVKKHIPDPSKAAGAVGKLLDVAQKNKNVKAEKLGKILDAEKYNLRIDGRHYTAEQIERMCRQFNPSMYMFRAEVFYRGVSMLDNNNAQGEYYLTDVIKHLGNVGDKSGSGRLRIRAVPTDNAELVQGFNSPDELLSIQDYIRRGKPKLKNKAEAEGALRCRLKKNQYRKVNEWIQTIEADSPLLKRWLRAIYGDHDQLHAEKRRELLKVLKCYGRRFGFDDKVVIVRAPGRVNLMGRHVDHRGGFNNFLAMHRETIAVAGLREDNNVVAVNTDPKRFKPQQFNVTELIGRFAWSDWLNFVNSDWVHNLLDTTMGEWGNYIKASMLRVQHKYQDLKIRGINMALCGSVPIAAGLSSSSTIVVATLRATISLNNLELTSHQFIDLCGEGEWFVGSRGGAGDHAAITLGRRGKIAQVGYLPFRVEKIADSPSGYQVMIAESHVKAPKSAGAKDQFNSRIAGYNLGLALLRQRCPEIADLTEYVRDINPDRLGCGTSNIYRYLMKVPEIMTRKDFVNNLSSEHKELIETNFASHADPGVYNVRGVLLYGAAECMRSRIAIDLLEGGQMERFGELMRISHDGDRVSRRGSDGIYKSEDVDCSNAALEGLIRDLGSEDPGRVLRGQLYMQPGGYGCSTEEIDRMVDIACSVPGVAGAQIAGAGLGGCIMIIAEKDSIQAVRKALVKDYYKIKELKPAIVNCVTVEGSRLVGF